MIGDFDRPNIFLSVRRAQSVREKQQHLARAATEFDGPGIVYAATHASAQAARDALDAMDHDALAAVGVGAGANVLVGGFNKSVTLQPVSISGETGLNVAAGIGELTLSRPGG